jgi:Amidohydrolase family
MVNIGPDFLLPPREEGQPVMPKELLIKGGYVVTVDPELGDLPGGDVLVADGVITAVGTGLEPATADPEVIDAVGRLVIPGLVDTHRHVWQGAIGGYTPQITGAGYGPAVLTGIALRHTPDDVYAGTLWGALQAIDAGITTIADWAHNDQSAAHADADLRGLVDSGIRGYFLYGGPGPASDDPNPPHPADGSGTWTTRSARSPPASRPTSRSSTCAHRTWTVSATRSLSWSSVPGPPMWKPLSSAVTSSSAPARSPATVSPTPAS